MEEPRHDLPTLHRPVTTEDNTRIDRFRDWSREVRALPTPPHQRSLMRRAVNSGREEGLSTLPSMLTDTNWRTRRAKQLRGELPEEGDYEDTYLELLSKRAYRYPHPGAPKSGRQGCIGGTWRHMKESIGYGPGRLMWIDGVVTLYDEESLNKEKPWRGHTAVESLGFQGRRQGFHTGSEFSRHVPVQNQPITVDRSSQWYSSNQPQPLPFATKPPIFSAPQGKHKGFYNMAQKYG